MNNAIRENLMKEAPAILSGFGAVGVIATAVLAARNACNAQRVLSEWREENAKVTEPTTKEVIAVVWRCYIPAAFCGAITLGCIVGSNTAHHKRQAAVALLYTTAKIGLAEYQKKVVDQLGEEKNRGILDAITDEIIDRSPPPKNQPVIKNRSEETLFYDAYSGRYFASTILKVKTAINEFNFELLTEMFKPVNDLYYLLGLENIEAGEAIGWDINAGQLKIDPYAKLIVDPGSSWDGQPCFVLRYDLAPRFL